MITERAAAGLSETATPQGIVAVCATLGCPAADALQGTRLVAVLAGVSDPGNAGTVIRVADAAGAGAVLFTGNAVDPHNGKCVRASTGSVFHLPQGMEPDPQCAVAACRQAGLQVLAADADSGRDLDDVIDSGSLAAPTAWLFGSEARGLDENVQHFRAIVSSPTNVKVFKHVQRLHCRPSPTRRRREQDFVPAIGTSQRLANLGVDAAPSTPTQLELLIHKETELWSKVIEAAGIKPE